MLNVQHVQSFVGCDAHSSTCSLKALSPDGDCLLTATPATNVRSLRKAVSHLPHPIWVMLESCPMAGFVSDALQKVVDRILVCETRTNRWIAMSADKSDANDADRLARQLRLGECRPVYCPDAQMRSLQELVRFHRQTVADAVRVKNRILDLYRRLGLRGRIKHPWDPKMRSQHLLYIKNKVLQFKMDVLYRKLDTAVETRDEVKHRIQATLCRRRDYRLIKTIPGVGPVLAAIFIAVIVDPNRFSTRQKLYRYAGLAVRQSSSGASSTKKGGDKTGNRLLKYAAMEAAKLCCRGQNRFSRLTEQLIDRGLDAKMAQRTVARKILATASALWKKGEAYNDAYA